MKNVIGVKGELLAKAFLEDKGHIILEQNFHSKFGEIDIVSLHKGTYHFNEVKTTFQTTYHPLEQITALKIRRFIKTVNYYRLVKKLGDIDLSIDAIGIKLSKDEPPLYYYEENITL